MVVLLWGRRLVYCYSEPNARKIRKINPGQAYIAETETGNIAVPWHEKDELFIFSSSGDHLETRSLFSDSALIKFFYDDEKLLSKVVNKKQSKLEIQRNYEGSDRLLLDQREIFVINGINEENMLTSCYHPGSTGRKKIFIQIPTIDIFQEKFLFQIYLKKFD